MKYALLFVGALFCALLLGPIRSHADIVSSPHNLAVTGASSLDSFGKRRICVYCHTPHRSKAARPAWDNDDRGRVYVKYWSPTLDAYPAGGAPPIDGVSRLCLSCHDGTVALAKGLGAGTRRVGGTRHVGGVQRRRAIELAGSHPLSFRITQALILKNNARDSPLKSLSEMKSDKEVKLDLNDKIQCTTCHDPHDDKYRISSGVPMYRKPTWEGVCLTCHIY